MALDDQTDLSRRDILKLSAATFTAVSTAAVSTAAVAACPVGGLPATAAGMTTAAGYILARLSERGVRHLFTVPAATCDGLLKAAEGGAIATIVTSSDIEAGYAADGYARIHGLAAVTVSYGPGTLSLINAIAGAYVERSPVVVINGGPSAANLSAQRELGVLFSHSSGSADLDLELFRPITAFAGRAATAREVPGVVDQAILVAITAQRPVYLELSKDLWEARVPRPAAPLAIMAPDAGEVRRARDLARGIKQRLGAAARPVLLLGVEVQRHGLGDAVAEFVAQTGLPYATTLLGKSVIPETTPGFIGVFDGERSPGGIRDVMLNADAVLALGCVFNSDYLRFVRGSYERLVLAVDGQVRAGRTAPVAAGLAPILTQLKGLAWQANPAWRRASRPVARAPRPASRHADGPGLTHDQVFAELRTLLAGPEAFVLVADTALSTHPAADLAVQGSNSFVCSAAWKSIGHSVGAALGVAFASDRRPLAVCGDGGFQTIAQALSTMARFQQRAIVVVIDNGVYGIELAIVAPPFFSEGCEAAPYLKLNRWNYVELAKAMGVSFAREVSTPAALRAALADATRATGPAFIAAKVPPRDLPAELRVG